VADLIYLPARSKDRLRAIAEELGIPMCRVVELGSELLLRVVKDGELFFTVGTKIASEDQLLADKLLECRLRYLEGRE